MGASGYQGDGAAGSSGRLLSTADKRMSSPGDSQWPLWEVFVQEKTGAPHEHAGSVHAVDREMALQNARDVYGRRGAVSMWVVPTDAITASSPDDAGPFFDPADDKPYRHPQFYKTPRGVRVY
jgi:ring-1,2-phenylacetyl-CoA epoxidase subunit PaaB